MNLNSSDRLRGASALFGAAFIYSTFGILIRQLATMFGDSAQTAVRFILAFAIITIINLIRKQAGLLPKKALISACFLGIVFGFDVLLFTVSVNNTKIANSVFMLYAGSVLSSLLLGTLLFKEKLTVIKIAAILVAILGLYMYSGALLSLTVGIVTGFGAGLFEGVANAIRKSLRGLNRNTVLQYQFAFSALITLSSAFIFKELFIKEVSMLSIVIVIVFALLQISLGNLLLFGFQHFDVNVGSIILATELVFATVISYFLFKETPTSQELIGGLFIFTGSILSTVDFSELLKRKK